MRDPKEDIIDRRQDSRINMEQELVDITWLDGDGQAHQVKCLCDDFSRGGMRIEHEFAISVNTLVNFKFQADHPESRTIPATVVRCLELINGKFSIGFKMHK
ncbi:PilZ domain-containing protein [Thalassotalea sp. ND16A]|uniref:PilZ domain-containing protein n=1 Tax=Thalassotalea sp. ND16A TaxID=1535422 RepID=UPI00051A4278|nr:PilZ domain-containing protein [Thalassotalea sp. ND16A]KGJ87470.1 hypothetical protein ND16A_2853 [Thalassotalea sp. ND16A]